MQLTIQDRGAVRLLTLNRPEALNAFDASLYRDASTALGQAGSDPATSVVVLTGTGRAFSAGTDLRELEAGGATRKAAVSAFEEFVDALSAFDKPLLCAVNGLAIGVGATLLHYADLVFIADDARVRYPFASMGLPPEAGSSWLLPEAVGSAAAAWILLSGEWLTSDRCVELGLAWRTCVRDAVVPDAMRHAELIAAHPLPALVEIKRLLRHGHREQICGARRREAEAFRRLLTPARTTHVKGAR